MGSVSRFIMGVIAGGVVGAAVGLLLAPSSGAQTQSQVKEYVLNVKSEIVTAAQQRRIELEQELARLRSNPPANEK